MATDFVTRAIACLVDTPGNRRNLKTLEKAKEQLVPFVGAGLSADFDYPAWHTLLANVAAEADQTAVVEPLLAELKFEEAAETVMRALPNRFEDALRDTFDPARLPRPLAPPHSNAAVCHLPRIARGLVITTNFDGVLEAAFEDAQFRFNQVFSGTRIREATQAVQLREHCLLKLHGDYLDSENRILTLSQYRAQYGGDGPDQIDPTLALPRVLSQALTSGPLLFLGCGLKTDRTTQVISRLAPSHPGLLHFALLSDSEATRERQNQLDLWQIRPLFFPRGEFGRIAQFLDVLAEHQAGWSPKRVIEGPAARPPAPTAQTRINGYKLFYFRKMQKLGTKSLAQSAGVAQQTIVRLERVQEKVEVLGIQCFQLCRGDVIAKLETALECPGALEAGQADDFLTHYTLFYRTYRGTGHSAAREEGETTPDFTTRAVVFDFDGTLTVRTDEETTWEKMWLKLGYTIDDCAKLHALYSNGKITHEQWCERTLEKFRERHFSRAHLDEIAAATKLVEGTLETLDTLKQRRIQLYVVSGSVKQVIARALPHWDLFEQVHANDMVFDSTGIISNIRGTRFDFEGKAEFIRRIVDDNGFEPSDVLFVGNSLNDVFAIQSGARTLCVNARATDQYNKQHWTYFISRMDNLSQILKYVSL